VKIKSVRIENFRSFSDETIFFRDYTCLVGPNGAGKSTILAALNVFFRQYKDSKTDLSKLSVDDFHHRDVSKPINITVTFTGLSNQAKSDLSDYYRQDLLIVSSVASYDTVTQRADVKQFGNRLGMDDFRQYFEADKAGSSAADLKDIFAKLRQSYPDLEPASTKPAMVAALQKYETDNPDSCALIPSEDQFYGATKGSNRLAPHAQWVFVPAVKDIAEEGEESKNSALGQLLSRTIRARVNFEEKISKLREGIEKEYQGILDSEQGVLEEISGSIQLKLKNWSHPNATAKVLWRQDPDRSVKIEEPWAYIRVGERGFESELARFGHGMQRSYMLTLLQEIASTEDDSAPTLIMGIEEPELYQHPPQIRYMAEVLHDLSQSGSQIALCSHSPLFVPGDDFESIRLVREESEPSASYVSQVTYENLSDRLHGAGQNLLQETGMLAKLYPSLNPTVNEMFFCRVVVLVEGISDVAYLTTYLHLTEQLNEFRRCHCHIVPVGGKSEIIKPLAIAKLLSTPVYIIIDADTDKEREAEIVKHKQDNKSILNLMGYEDESEWPDSHILKDDLTVWHTNIEKVVKNELGGGWQTHIDVANAHYGNAGGLQKNPLAISKSLESAWNENLKSGILIEVVTNLISYAKAHTGG